MSTPGQPPKYDQVEFPDIDSLRTWLETHHSSSPGVWAVTAKKGQDTYVAYPDLVREALRVGWIDSQPRSVDETRNSRLLTPRRPTSAWSRVNKAHIEALQRAGDLHPAGLAAVDLARRNGTWSALDEVEDLLEPDDLAYALDTAPGARGHWDGFPRSAKRAILEWISQARTDETRARRITTTASEAAVGRRANQWRQPRGTS